MSKLDDVKNYAKFVSWNKIVAELHKFCCFLLSYICSHQILSMYQISFVKLFLCMWLYISHFRIGKLGINTDTPICIFQDLGRITLNTWYLTQRGVLSWYYMAKNNQTYCIYNFIRTQRLSLRQYVKCKVLYVTRPQVFQFEVSVR